MGAEEPTVRREVRAPRATAAGLLACSRGAGLVEYIVVIGVVALVAVAGFRVFGTKTYSKVRTAGDDVANLSPMKAGSDYCFAAGTLVATPDGSRPIEQIRVGDVVLSRDGPSGATAAARVTATFVTPDAPLVELRIREQPEPIRATPGHLFFTEDRGWVGARELAPGEELPSASGATLHVEGVARLEARGTVYNFEVERTHTYFVGSGAAWVHNPTDCNGNPLDEGETSDNCFVAGTPVETPDGPRPIEQVAPGDLVLSRDEETGEVSAEHVVATFETPGRPIVDLRLEETRDEALLVTPGHRFWTLDRGWVGAQDLQPGEVLLDARGEWLHVHGVSPTVRRQVVYNFEVEQTHTYFAGGARVWVHNKRCKKDPPPPAPPPPPNIRPYPYRPQSGSSMLTQPFIGKHFNPGDGRADAINRFNTPPYNITSSTNVGKSQQNKFSNEIGDNSKEGTYAQAFQQASQRCGDQHQVDPMEFRTNQSYKTQTYRRQGGPPPNYTASPSEVNDSPFYYSMTYDPTTQSYSVNHFAGNATPGADGSYGPPAGGPWEHINVNGTDAYFQCR
jgi:hypothetical protein